MKNISPILIITFTILTILLITFYYSSNKDKSNIKYRVSGISENTKTAKIIYLDETGAMNEETITLPWELELRMSYDANKGFYCSAADQQLIKGSIYTKKLFGWELYHSEKGNGFLISHMVKHSKPFFVLNTNNE